LIGQTPDTTTEEHPMAIVETTPAIPGYLTGTWAIDPVHSEVSFTVRHLMLSKVRGRFTDFAGTFVTAADPVDSSVNATVELTSIDTANPDRDAHIRNEDFFDVDKFPQLVYRSTAVRPDDDGGFVVDGELTLHGVTRAVPLQLEVNGFQPETPFGDTRAGFSATAEIDRREFGIEFNSPLAGGGVGLANKINITLEIQAILQSPSV
jgi:polyisoprenoid-binding protein YceI